MIQKKKTTTQDYIYINS